MEQATVNSALLLLADSRLPAGAYAHSGGLEAAAQIGAVRDLDDLAGFLRGRVATAGLVAAALAAAACAHAEEVAGGAAARWSALDREADARIPAPAQRAASRAQGRALLRAGGASWPHPVVRGLAATTPAGPHQPVALGACAFAAGGRPQDAAVIAASAAMTGPASAAVRLLGLDPLAVQRLLADLAAASDHVATAAACAARAGDWGALPAAAAPLLDVFAERHHHAEVRLFES